MNETKKEEKIQILEEIRNAWGQAMEASSRVKSFWDGNNILEIFSDAPSDLRKEMEDVVIETPPGFECKEEKEFFARKGMAIELSRKILNLCRLFLERHRALISLGEVLWNLGPISEFGSILDIRMLQISVVGMIGTIHTQQCKIAREIDSYVNLLRDLAKLETEFYGRINEQGELWVESSPIGQISYH
jgi:hypothetical protein